MSGFLINPYAFGGSSATLTMPLLVTWEAGGDSTQTFQNDGTATGSVQWNGFTAKRDSSAYTSNGSTYGLDCRFNNDSVRYHGISGMSFGTQDFTVEAFCYVNDTPPGTSPTVYFDIVDSSNNVIVRFEIGGDSDRKWGWGVGGNFWPRVQSSAISLGTWWHLCAERTGDTVKFYVDGTEEDSRTLSTSQDLGDADEVWFGEDYAGNLDARGDVDDCRVTLGGNVYGSAFSVPSMDLGDTST